MAVKVNERNIDDEFDEVTNYRFQPVTNGYYHVSVGIYVIGLANGKYLQLHLRKNGSSYRMSAKTSGVGGFQTTETSCDLYLTTSDYIEIWAQHDHGSNLNFDGSLVRNYMTVHRFA